MDDTKRRLNLVENGIFPLKGGSKGHSQDPESTGFSVTGTLQGSGKTLGIPSLFIRTSGCNLRCWVINDGNKYHPIVVPSKGRQKKMIDVNVGDKLIAIDESAGKLVETEVIGKRIDHDVTEYMKIKLEKFGTFYVTPEHPFLTVNNGWVKAKDLNKNHILQHFNSSDIRKFKFGLYPYKPSEEARERMSERMKKNNPMFDPEIAKKTHSHPNYIKTRINSGKMSSKVRREKGITWKDNLSEERIEELNEMNSERMKKNNPMFDPEIVGRSIKNRLGRHAKKSSLEMLVEECVEELGLSNEIWFTGHGDYFVTNTETGQVRNPDFKISGTNKLIEVGQEFIWRPNFEEYEFETHTFYEQSGYDVLVIEATGSKQEIKNQLLTYYRNGLQVQDVKKIQRKNPVDTINIDCYPYSNYVVNKGGNYISNHNCSWIGSDGNGSPCDTPYSSHKPEKNMMSIGSILATVEANLMDTNIRHIIVSGGEPTLQTKPLGVLLEKLQEMGLHTTIETNGTIYDKRIADNTNFFSISPKLSSSTPWEENLKNTGIEYNEKWANRHERDRINVESLQKYIDSCYVPDIVEKDGERISEPNYSQKYSNKDFQLKFVVSKPEDFEEIQKDFIDHLTGFNPEDIVIMPEGVSVEDLESRSKWIPEMAIERGWRFTPRLHILLFGKNRYV